MGLSIQGGLNVDSQSINTVKIESIVTKDTAQVLDVNILKGNVIIHNLHVNHLYDDINVTQLDESLVKLSGEQFISSTLIFRDDLEVENLELSKLNDLPPDIYVYASEGFTITDNMTIENMSVERLKLEGDLHSNTTKPDLDRVRDNYLSITKNQTITQPWILKTAFVEELDVAKVGDELDVGIFNESSYEKWIKSILGNDTVHIESK